MNARLVISGSNFKTDTIPLDLNPIHIEDFSIDSVATELDYRGGVKIRWQPLRNEPGVGRRSDFLGYVVTRGRETPPGDTVLLTAEPISSACYYYDTIPLDTEGTYVYTVAAVDSSRNYCVEATSAVSTPRFIKKGFPLFVDASPRLVNVGDWNRDGEAEVYTQAPAIMGVRPNGQWVTADSVHNGVIAPEAAWGGWVMADIDADGKDEIIFQTWEGGVGAYDLETGLEWTVSLIEGHARLDWSHSQPAVADLDNDGHMEMVCIGMDNGAHGTSGATTLYLIDSIEQQNWAPQDTAGRIMRADFYDSSFASSFAVGDFFTSYANLEILTTAMTRHDHDTAWGFTWKLYLYKPNFTTRELSKMDEIRVCTRMVPKDGSTGGNGAGVNSPLSVGNLHGSSDILEVVFSTGKAFGDNDAGDTLVVYQLNTATGEFVQGRKAWYPVNFARYTKVSGSPAIGKLDTVAGDDIAFATDDNLYLLRMSADTGGILTSIHAGESVPFGNVPNNRLFDDDPLPQPLIARVDTAGECDVLVNHWGDGMIWAFGVDTSMTVKRKPGFPLRTNSRISQAPVVADLEGDGILDLVAVDDGGYAYAWNLAPGSVYNQPWPSARGNEWNSAFAGYKPLGPNGYVREDWVTEKIAPYAWVETGINNALSAPETAGFERQPDSMRLNNTSSSYRNYHLTGPKLAGLSNYTISGAMMRGSDTTQMGVNLYSEWPDSARKYELSVQGNGTLNVKYYNNGYQTVGSYSAVQAQSGQWFKYKAKVSTVGGTNIFGVKWWQTDETEPDSFQISASHSSATNSGTVGTFAGVGSGSWSPILVSSGHSMSGSIIANEDFKVDSLVDVKPFIPANWHSDYSSIRLYLGVDTTGFVLDTTGPGASLAYRHKEGINYPATCRLIAPTNLEYRNYEFSGKIVKPEGAVYDSIGVGVVVYSQGNKWYALKTNGSAYGNNYFYLTRDSLHNEQLVSVILDTINKWEFEGSNDAADFKIQVSTNNDIVGQDTIIDANVKIDVKVWLPIENEPDWDIQRSFVQEQRILSGMPGVYLSNYQPTSLCDFSAQPVRYYNVKLKKVD